MNGLLVLPLVLPEQSPRKVIFERPCKSRKKCRTFAPRFDRRRKGLKSETGKNLKTSYESLTIQNFFLPLHSQIERRENEERKDTGREATLSRQVGAIHVL